MIVDFHTHCYPASLASVAISRRWKNRKYHADGTVDGLLQDLRFSGVDRAVVLHVARKPNTMYHVNDFAAQVQREHPDIFRCFGSVHPDAPDALDELQRIRQMGLHGIKLHPSFQNFDPVAPRYFPLYEEIGRLGLPTLFHCGRHRTDGRILQPREMEIILPHFGNAPVIGAHLCGLRDDVTHDNLAQLNLLADLPVYVDLGYCVNYFTDAEVDQVLSRVRPERVLYGSDTPWIDAVMQLEQLRRMRLDAPSLERILYKNACELLHWE